MRRLYGIYIVFLLIFMVPGTCKLVQFFTIKSLNKPLNIWDSVTVDLIQPWNHLILKIFRSSLYSLILSGYSCTFFLFSAPFGNVSWIYFSFFFLCLFILILRRATINNITGISLQILRYNIKCRLRLHLILN